MPDIDVVRRLRPTAGDVLVIETTLSEDQIPSLAEAVENFIPDGVRYALVRTDVVRVELREQAKVRAVQAAALRDLADDLESGVLEGHRDATLHAVAEMARQRADVLEQDLVVGRG